MCSAGALEVIGRIAISSATPSVSRATAKMSEIFALSKPLWEIALRVTTVYLAIIVLMRVVPKRNAEHISPNDMLTLIVIGGIGTDSILGGSTSLDDIVVIIGVVLVWSYGLDQLEFRFPRLRSLLRDSPSLMIDNGRMVRRNMRRELVTEEELMVVLRKEGIADVSDVRSARLKADGEISVVKA